MKREKYNHLLSNGFQRLRGSKRTEDPMDLLVKEFQDRRANGEKLSIRSFCSAHRIVQGQFEAKLYGRTAQNANTVHTQVQGYYSRQEVQEALFLWAQGRRLAAHYHHGVIGMGFRKPKDVVALAAAAVTEHPTFHASVGRYDKNRLIDFELVAEVDFKGDWKECFRVIAPLVHALHEQKLNFMVKFSGHSSAHVLLPCKGSNYNETSGEFLRKIPSSLRGCSKLDMTFRFPQHFLRAPYALHEKTGLVSLPLTLEQFDRFDPEMAVPENVTPNLDMLRQYLQADNSWWLS